LTCHVPAVYLHGYASDHEAARRLVVVAILLELAAGVGLAHMVGWSQVRAVLGDFDGRWLVALVGALLVSFVGYHYAYRGGSVQPARRVHRIALSMVIRVYDGRAGRRWPAR
jgi:hypothetical protein